MSTIGNNIKSRRKELGLTQEELQKKMGYKDRTSIAKIELGMRDVPLNKVKKFASALDCTPQYLLGFEDKEDYALQQAIPSTTKGFPILGQIACGEPIYAEEQEVYVATASNVKADFCLIARGESMVNAGINDGDIVFIRKQPSVVNGEIAVVVIGEEATLKRVYFDKKAKTLVLQAENPAFKPLLIAGEQLNQCSILGKAVALQRSL